MSEKTGKIEEIHDSLVNGQRRQMVRQINSYGTYDFWADYAAFLADLYSVEDAYEHFKDATVSYFHIKDFLHTEYDK